MPPLSNYLQALNDTSTFDPTFNTTETVLARMYMPVSALPEGDAVDIQLDAALTTLTAANVATLRVRTGTSSGPIVLTMTISAIGTIVTKAGELSPAPTVSTPIFVTAQITTGSGSGSIATAALLLSAFPVEEEVELDRREPRAEPDFGTDIEAFDDPYPSFTLVSGPRNYLLAIARRFITDTAFLADVTGDEDPDAAEHGLNLMAMLNLAQGSAQLKNLPTLIADQARLDERTQDATAEVDFDITTSTMRVDLRLEAEGGPYRLIMNVSQLTVQILDGDNNLVAATS